MKKSLIVCYSYSGNTLRVAEEIRRQTGAPLCEIYPKQPYPMLFDSVLAQVRREVATGVLPSLFPIAENVAEYDTIFVGTPDWCGTIAPPIASFLQKNNLEGKHLFPFSTHCGVGAGMAEQDMRRMCPRAAVGEGISIVHDGGDKLPAMIASWLARI